MVIFIALILHKGPAAIGLSTFLIHEKLKYSKMVIHLLIFTISSPLASVITYYMFYLFASTD